MDHADKQDNVLNMRIGIRVAKEKKREMRNLFAGDLPNSILFFRDSDNN
jgi:hypothetical protein